MSLFFAVFLFAVLQGLTEFLPISSSGHLVLFQYFSKNLKEDMSLNIAVHFGTLLTILVYYRKDLIQIIKEFFRGQRWAKKALGLILIANGPTAVIGLFFKKSLGWTLTHPLVAGLCLIVTGVSLLAFEKRTFNQTGDQRSPSGVFFSRLLKFHKYKDFLRTDRKAEGFMEIFTKKYNEKNRGFGINLKQAIIIGVIQGLAVLPGISRSGTTIITGLFFGMSPEQASRFSFLISVPAIAGACLLEILSHSVEPDFSQIYFGILVSFITGLFAISWMVSLTKRLRFRGFAFYLIFISVSFLVLYVNGLGKGFF